MKESKNTTKIMTTTTTKTIRKPPGDPLGVLGVITMLPSSAGGFRSTAPSPHIYIYIYIHIHIYIYIDIYIYIPL